MEDVKRVEEFRGRLAAFASKSAPQTEEETAWLAQAYGRLAHLFQPYGAVEMRRYGMVVSQDVIRDAIGSPSHPGYIDVAQMAIQHVDEVIGRLRAQVERHPSSRENLYRLTSPVYWAQRLAAVARWLMATTRGRIVALGAATGIAIIGGVASGVAQAWFTQLLNGPSPHP